MRYNLTNETDSLLKTEFEISREEIIRCYKETLRSPEVTGFIYYKGKRC